MGESTGHETQRIFGRFHPDKKHVSTDVTTHSDASPQDAVIRLDHQHQEVCAETGSKAGAFGFSTGFNNYASSSTAQEITGSQAFSSSGNQKPNSNTSYNSQFNDAHSSNNLCDISSSIVHQTPVASQESQRSVDDGLGYADNSATVLSTGVTPMDSVSTEMERSIISPTNTQRDSICGREQHRLGMQLEQPNSSRVLDGNRGSTVDQLARTPSSISSNQIFSTDEHNIVDSHGQYDITELHQQTRGDEITTVDGTCNSAMEILSSAPHSSDRSACARDSESSCRFSVSSSVLQKSVDDSAGNISTDLTVLEHIPRRRLICRSHNDTPTKVRLVEDGSGIVSCRRIFYTMDSISTPMDESTLESGTQMLAQDYQRTITSGDNGGTSLDIQSILSSASTTGDCTSPTPHSPTPENVQPNDSQPTQAELEALRMAALNNKFGKNDLLTQESRAYLSSTSTGESTTNDSY